MAVYCQACVRKKIIRSKAVAFAGLDGMAPIAAGNLVDFYDAITEADKAMNEAKEHGRNQMFISGPWAGALIP